MRPVHLAERAHRLTVTVVLHLHNRDARLHLRNAKARLHDVRLHLRDMKVRRRRPRRALPSRIASLPAKGAKPIKDRHLVRVIIRIDSERTRLRKRELLLRELKRAVRLQIELWNTVDYLEEITDSDLGPLIWIFG